MKVLFIPLMKSMLSIRAQLLSSGYFCFDGFYGFEVSCTCMGQIQILKNYQRASTKTDS
jgi:hypothetical protein